MESTEAELENAFLSGGLVVGYYDHFNSAGESASEISSTPSSVSSETAAESAEDPGPPSAGQPHRPLRHRPLVQLQRLDEQGVIGACRRGRKRGRKNRPQSQRMAEVDDKRVQKNARERERVYNVNEEYRRLRQALGDDFRKKKHNKLKTLTAAINYIQAMMTELDTLKREAGEMDEHGPSPSDGSYPVAVEPEGQLHVAGGYDMQRCPGDLESQVGSSCHSTPRRPTHSPPINLSCDESLEPNEEPGSSNELELHTIIHHEEVFSSIYPEEVYPCPVVPPQGSYFTMVCSPEPSYMNSPSAGSSTPQTLLAATSPGGNDLMFSSVATPMPLQNFSSPESFQPLPLAIPALSCEAESSTGYVFPMQPDLPETQHSWSSTPLSSPPALSHYNYPTSVLHS